MRTLTKALTVTAIVGAAAAVYGLHWFGSFGMQAFLQKLVDDSIPGNGMTVTFVSLPFSTAIPLAGPDAFDGYFSFKRTDGGSMPDGCEAETVDYQARKIGTNYAIEIPGDELEKLVACR